MAKLENKESKVGEGEIRVLMWFNLLAQKKVRSVKMRLGIFFSLLIFLWSEIERNVFQFWCDYSGKHNDLPY